MKDKIIIMIFQTALVSPSNEEYEYIMEIIKERVEEGQGETIYEVGVGGEIECLQSQNPYDEIFYLIIKTPEFNL